MGGDRQHVYRQRDIADHEFAACWLMLAFGVVGWLMKRYDWSAAPMVLGLVLGPLFENTLRQSLTLSHGSGLIFLSRPISAVLVAISLIAVMAPPLINLIRQRRALASA
jgi:putative tricarboxylic transport membrane protein